MVAIKGHFDGKVFVPDESVDVPRNEPLILHVQLAAADRPGATQTLWDVLEKHTGSVDMPSDWSAEHDHYLYGTPKKRQGPKP